jgi:hypothetical protein
MGMSATALYDRIITAVEGDGRLTPMQWLGRVVAAILLPGGLVALIAYGIARLAHDFRMRGRPPVPRA